MSLVSSEPTAKSFFKDDLFLKLLTCGEAEVIDMQIYNTWDFTALGIIARNWI